MKRGARTKTRGRDLSRGQEDVLLLVHSASFPHGPRPHPSLIKASSPWDVRHPIWWRHFLSCHFFFSDNYCIATDIKPWTTKGEQEVSRRGLIKGHMQSGRCKEEPWSWGNGEGGEAGKKGEGCPGLLPCCCKRTLTKWNLGKGRVYLSQPILRAARAGMWRQEPLKSQNSAASWLTSQTILILLFDLSQDHLPRGWNDPQWVGSSLISHKARQCPQGQIQRPRQWRPMSHLRISCPRWLWLISSCQKITRMRETARTKFEKNVITKPNSL